MPNVNYLATKTAVKYKAALENPSSNSAQEAKKIIAGNPYEKVFRKIFLHDEFPHNVYVFSKFVYEHPEAHDLFDPVEYAKGKDYKFSVDKNVNNWNKIIRKYDNIADAIKEIKDEQKKVKATTSNSSESDDDPSVPFGTSKKSNNTINREDR